MTDTTVATTGPNLAPAPKGSWPGPSGPAPAVVVRGVVAAGVVAAFAVPLDRPGVGWLVGSAAVVTAVAVAGWGQRGGRPSISRWLWSGTALALIAVGAIRAAEWLFTLCVLAAGLAAVLALTEGRSLKGLVAGPLDAVNAMVRGVAWVGRGFPSRGMAGSRSRRLAVSVVLAVGLAVVFGALFAGADAAFASLVDDVIPRVDGGSVAQWIMLFLVVAVLTAAALYLVVAPPPTADGPGRARKPVRLVEWALPVGVLFAMFTAFVLVQLAVLFGGREYMLRTAGLTAAEYARKGFWQLCVVTMLAQVVIAVAARKAPVATRAERAWLRGLLGGLTVMTLVIVASALTRMWAYQESYGYTVPRLVVATCELWFGVVLLMVLAAGIGLRAPWLPRAVVGSAMGALLVLAVVNPEGYVAERNVARYAHTGKIDAAYLGSLSVDAAPALARLPEPQRSCALMWMRPRFDAYGRDGWQDWNLGRWVAHDLLDGAYLPVDGTKCAQNE